MRFIAIHGWPDSPKLFNSMSEVFTKQGHSFYSIQNYVMTLEVNIGIDRIIQDIDDVYDDSEPIIIIGHDWGAFFSNRIAIRYKELGKPERISLLVMLDVGTAVDVTEWFKFLVTWQGISILSYFTKSTYIQRRITSFVGAPEPTDNYQINRVFLTAFNLQNWDVNYEIPIKPTLFIRGSSFKFYTDTFLNHIQNNSDCEYYYIEGGHWFLLTNPDETYKLILEFVNKK